MWATIGSENGFLPCQRQAITWTNVHLLIIGFVETNKKLIKIQHFHSRKCIRKGHLRYGRHFV